MDGLAGFAAEPKVELPGRTGDEAALLGDGHTFGGPAFDDRYRFAEIGSDLVPSFEAFGRGRCFRARARSFRHKSGGRGARRNRELQEIRDIQDPQHEPDKVGHGATLFVVQQTRM